jgi:hypothetical protein
MKIRSAKQDCATFRLYSADLEVRMSEQILEGMCCVLNENVLI